MPYIFILTFSTMLLLTGCLATPKAAMHAKLSPYKSLQNGCTKNPPKALEQECALFLNDLEAQNTLLQKMENLNEDEKAESAYTALAAEASARQEKLQNDKAVLAGSCQAKIRTIIQNDDLNSAEFCLLFEKNPFTLEMYRYLKRHAPRFDIYPQYRAFEEAYASQHIEKGLAALNRGDKHAALNAFQTASDANSAEAKYLIGIIYEAKHVDKAIEWHKEALAHGIERSKLNLARLHLRIKMPHKAKQWYLSAAEGGDALAQYRLFKMDAKSKSIKAREEAQMWLERSAKNNYPQAQYIYGLQLLKQKKKQEAIRWLEKAENNGVTDTRFFLGRLYFQEKAYQKAYPMLMETQNRGEANVMLARMYEEGLEIEQNHVLAYRHYKKAHEFGQNNCIADMQRVQKKITRQERQAAKGIVQKEAKAQKEARRTCGDPVDNKNIKIRDKTVRIVGVSAGAQRKSGGLTVYGDHERLYYIIDPKIDDGLKAYQKVDLLVKATGNSVEISDDSGALQRVYRTYYLKNCNLN
ncbi:tetratricopeptide repeat protein [Sulfurimonas sp. HSL3-7]|uniref:SEL1-like repeat protein n=1 Tax=Sulfonitrofixus jiaomeiensis TaxID=3131938 RepID=UPI0031F8AF05